MENELIIKELTDKTTRVGSCLVWMGPRRSSGRHGDRSRYYGTKRYKGKTWAVHRLMWTIKRGEIPQGICVAHSCDNPPCLNIDHLFLATHSENMQDKIAKKRDHNLNKKVCPRGHEYSGENLYTYPSESHRVCRTCRNISGRKYYYKNLEKIRKQKREQMRLRSGAR